jgi:asparagine synthase (glutamine-hydrolysing)
MKGTEKRITDIREAVFKLEEVLEKSIYLAVRDFDRVPIAFSGGLDSCVLAKMVSKFTTPLLYVVGFPGSYDIGRAENAANFLGFALKKVEFSHDLEFYVRKVIKLIKNRNPVKVGIALPFLILCEEVSKEHRVILSGQGADELFAGYARYEKSTNLEKDLLADLIAAKRQLEKDRQIALANSLELRTPFLDQKVVEIALRIDPSLKVHNGGRKYVLRELAGELGLPNDIVSQRKKAIQYGSGFHRNLVKLAKSKGLRLAEYLGSFRKK